MSLGPQQFIVWPRLPAYNDQTLVDWELVLWKRLTFAGLTNVCRLSLQAHTFALLKALRSFSGLFSPLDATEAVYPTENAGAVYQTLDMMPLFWQEASTAHEHLLTTYARIGMCSSSIYASH
jgi:hypothetical protein